MRFRLVWVLLMTLAITACGNRGKVRQPPPERETAVAVASADPCAVIYEHDEADYTPGGLYRPGQSDHAPTGKPDLSRIPEPVPKREPLSRYGNDPSYTVLGKRYHVLRDTRGYRERGTASWYGAKFHGRSTSSMEPYDMCRFSAAHKTLPLPSYARVTNLENGRSVIVRVNDRGPFHAGRVIDLSYVAALKLGVYETGTARVEVEAVGPAIDAQASDAESEEPVYLQVGVFAERGNAERLLEQLRAAGERARIVESREDGRRLYRVRVGPLRDPTVAEEAKARLRLRGFVAAPIVIAD